jgi:hypothetical protein
MKTTTIAICAILFALTLNAQEQPKQREVGVIFHNFDGFGLTYRTGTPKALWRFSSFNFDFSHNKSKMDGNDAITKSNSAGIGVAIGREYRKPLSDRFALRYGVGVVSNYNRSSSKIENPDPEFDSEVENINISGGVQFIAGLNYSFGERFLLGLELLPSVIYNNSQSQSISSTNNQKISNSGTSFGLNNSIALISIVYKW